MISHINDLPTLKPADDTITSNVIVNDTFITKKLMHETFTSSTSQNAKTGNENLHNVLNNHPNLFTELNYPFRSPSGGDPYYTTEVAARGRYYNNINTVPTTLLDGITSIDPSTYNTQIFSQYQQIPSFFQIIPSGTVKGQYIEIKVELKNEAPLDLNTKLYIAISEKVTTKNVKTNGETSFLHVLKKFLPDTLGIIVGILPADDVNVFDLSWKVPGSYRLPTNAQSANIIDLATEHSIEDFSNLEVIAWLQDDDRTILQSNSANLQFTVSNQDLVVTKELNINPNPASDYFFVDMSGFDAIQDLKVFIADKNGKLIYAENTSLKSLFINSTNWTPGLYHVKVVGKNQEGNRKIIVVK